MTYSTEEDRFSVCSEVSSVQDLEDQPPNMLHTLLSEIYTQYQWSSSGLQTPVFDSNVYDDYFLQDNCLYQRAPITHMTREQLMEKDVDEIQSILTDLEQRTKEQSTKLVGILRRKDQGKTRQKRGYALLTRLLQTVTTKTKSNGAPIRGLRFIMPPPSDNRGFNQWFNSLRALVQVAPYGIDAVWRAEVWLGCAEHVLREVEWSAVNKFAFNEKLNPDDHMLGVQIVKDLHRTGSCRLLSPSDDRAALKRVLLAYARWNKEVGYCQGFNIITAVLLKVLGNNEPAALKVMIHVVENLLPEHYFNNNLIALSVDLAVFRELLRLHLPKLWSHISKLQGPVSTDAHTYEPPLTNVFTMQWFLTLFATCLPNELALRVWDLIFLYGAEVLFRVALAIWGSLQSVVLQTQSSDEFYGLMSKACLEIQAGRQLSCEELMKKIHSIPPLGASELVELREQIMYNIQPPNLGLYTNGAQNDINCMSLLMNPNRAIEAPVVPSHSNPSLRETIKKREVEVTSRDIAALLSKYRQKSKMSVTAKAGQPAGMRCPPDLGPHRRKLPEKAFSFDSAELSSRQILLQQVSGFSPSQRPTPRRLSSPQYQRRGSSVPSSPVRKCLFPEDDKPNTSTTVNNSSAFSAVTDALAHVRVSRIPDTQTEEFCNSGYNVQRPIQQKAPSGVQAQTQGNCYPEVLSKGEKSEVANSEECLTEVYFEEEEELDTSTEQVPETAEQKRKAWMKKSKTVPTLVYSSLAKNTENKSRKPVSPPFSRPYSPFTNYKQVQPFENNGMIQQTTAIPSRGPSFEQSKKTAPNLQLTRVVHAGQTSDPYFNLRKNQAFLADMHNWSMTNATALPFAPVKNLPKSISEGR